MPAPIIIWTTSPSITYLKYEEALKAQFSSFTNQNPATYTQPHNREEMQAVKNILKASLQEYKSLFSFVK